MSEETVVGLGVVGVLVAVLAIVAGVLLSVDSLANCARSCGNKGMARYSEEARMGSASRVPVCECGK